MPRSPGRGIRMVLIPGQACTDDAGKRRTDRGGEWFQGLGFTLRVQVPNSWVLGFRVVVIIVEAWGKYMIIGYLDP